MRVLFGDNHPIPTIDYSKARQWSWQLFTDIYSAKDIWEKLETDANLRIFQSYSWISAWYEEIGKNEEIDIRIVVGSRNGKVMALFPLALKRSRGVEILTWLAEDWNDYSMPIAHLDLQMTSSEQCKLWDMALNAAGPSDIAELAKQSPLKDHSIVNKFYRSDEILEDDCAFLLTLSNDEQKLRDTIHSPKTWHGYKRKLRKLEKNSVNISFEEAATAEMRHELVNEMLEQKVRALNDSGKSNPFREMSAIRFLNSLALRAPKTCRVFALRADGEPIAITLCFQEQDNLLLYQTVYDNDYGQYSPGILLLHHIILKVAKEGTKTFDCSYGSDRYKELICNKQIVVGRVLEAFTLRGYIYKFQRRVTLFVRRTVKANPTLYRIMLRLNKRLRFI